MWTLDDAETTLGRIFRRALSDGPQKITDGSDTVVVIAQADYDRLRSKPRKPPEIED